MRRTIAGGAIAAAVLVGGVAGAMAFGLGTANAVTPTPSVAPAASASPTTGGTVPTGAPTDPQGQGGPGGHGGGLGPNHETVTDTSVAATAIGISEADLTTALSSGQSMAAVAKAHNVDPQKVIDALVADAQSEISAEVTAGSLTQAQADAEQANVTARVTDQVNGTMAASR